MEWLEQRHTLLSSREASFSYTSPPLPLLPSPIRRLGPRASIQWFNPFPCAPPCLLWNWNPRTSEIGVQNGRTISITSWNAIAPHLSTRHSTLIFRYIPPTIQYYHLPCFLALTAASTIPISPSAPSIPRCNHSPSLIHSYIIYQYLIISISRSDSMYRACKCLSGSTFGSIPYVDLIISSSTGSID